MNRLEANSAILNIIREYAEANPELRFHQILWNLEIFEWEKIAGICEIQDNVVKDKHHEESEETLADLRVGTIEKRSDR